MVPLTVRSAAGQRSEERADWCWLLAVGGCMCCALLGQGEEVSKKAPCCSPSRLEATLLQLHAPSTSALGVCGCGTINHMLQSGHVLPPPPAPSHAAWQPLRPGPPEARLGPAADRRDAQLPLRRGSFPGWVVRETQAWRAGAQSCVPWVGLGVCVHLGAGWRLGWWLIRCGLAPRPPLVLQAVPPACLGPGDPPVVNRTDKQRTSPPHFLAARPPLLSTQALRRARAGECATHTPRARAPSWAPAPRATAPATCGWTTTCCRTRTPASPTPVSVCASP